MRLALVKLGSAPAGLAALAIVVGTALIAPVPRAVGDIFHLTSGGRVEGELLASEGGQYKIRTALGLVTLAADAVEHIEAAASPFQEYDQRRAAAADTATDQVALAQWCEEQGLGRERLVHLRRALELDPDCRPARAALGYIRIGDMWVDGRTVVERERPAAGPAAGDASGPDDPQKLAAAIQGNWRRRISAIRSIMLDNATERQAERARQRIDDIKDPLAIVPLVQVLADGSVLCRKILVETLARFPEDAATVNLAALALVDPDGEVRQQVVSELVRRKDQRVTGQFRKALESGDEVLIRRAAEALGALGATDAIPDLVNVLKAPRRKMVDVPVPRYVGGLGDAFNGTVMQIGSVQVPVRALVALSNPASMIDVQRRLMNVTVFRTEVLEALRRITGKDFGFDAAEWARWYQESRP